MVRQACHRLYRRDACRGTSAPVDLHVNPFHIGCPISIICYLERYLTAAGRWCGPVIDILHRLQSIHIRLRWPWGRPDENKIIGAGNSAALERDLQIFRLPIRARIGTRELKPYPGHAGTVRVVNYHCFSNGHAAHGGGKGHGAG